MTGTTTGTTTGRRHRPVVRVRTTLVVTLLGAVLLGAGCNGAGDDPSPTDPQAGLGAAPAPTASDGGEAAGNGGEAAGTTGYPETARAYAEAVVDAWTAGDLARLAELTTAGVHDQLIQIPGPPPPDWTWIACDEVAYCSFYNSDGDHLTMQVPVVGLGAPHAVDQVGFTTTTYPDDHVDYVREFVTAWQSGNTVRMHQLALPEVVEVFEDITPGEVSSYGSFHIAPALVGVMITGVGFEVEVHVRTMYLGHPEAIAVAIREI
jgi:hypothetical protein